jgi:hypothetical protein
MAEKAVNEVWESCSKDTRPFDEVSLRAFYNPTLVWYLRLAVLRVSREDAEGLSTP